MKRASTTRVTLDPEASALMKASEHPLAKEIEVVRREIVGADPSIVEAVKWKAPSFRTTDFFATVNLRSKERVQLVFHTGAKVKASAKSGLAIEDPEGLCEWLAKDRCLVTVDVGVPRKRKALVALVRQWIRNI